LFDLSWVAHFFANFAYVKGIIVTLRLSLRVCDARILPSLSTSASNRRQPAPQPRSRVYSGREEGKGGYLRNSTIGEWVSVMGETIPDEPQFPFFNVLFDGIVILVL
jgi:hypothetical protein